MPRMHRRHARLPVTGVVLIVLLVIVAFSGIFLYTFVSDLPEEQIMTDTTQIILGPYPRNYLYATRISSQWKAAFQGQAPTQIYTICKSWMNNPRLTTVSVTITLRAYRDMNIQAYQVLYGLISRIGYTRQAIILSSGVYPVNVKAGQTFTLGATFTVQGWLTSNMRQVVLGLYNGKPSTTGNGWYNFGGAYGEWAITVSGTGLCATTQTTTTVGTKQMIYADVTRPEDLAAIQYGYMLEKWALDPSIKDFKVLLPKQDTDLFRAGILDWYDKSIIYSQRYGGPSLYDAYPITFRTDAKGDENIIVSYVVDAGKKCFGMSAPNALIACTTAAVSSSGGLLYRNRVLIYFDVAFQNQNIYIRGVTRHEFGHALGLGEFYRSPPCFGYAGDIMCVSSAGCVTTMDIYAVLYKWKAAHESSPKCVYGILRLPSNIPYGCL